MNHGYSIQGVSAVIPTRVGGTRWVPHLLQTLTHLINGIQAIYQHLTQV